MCEVQHNDVLWGVIIRSWLLMAESWQNQQRDLMQKLGVQWNLTFLNTSGPVVSNALCPLFLGASRSLLGCSSKEIFCFWFFLYPLVSERRPAGFYVSWLERDSQTSAEHEDLLIGRETAKTCRTVVLEDQDWGPLVWSSSCLLGRMDLFKCSEERWKDQDHLAPAVSVLKVL